MADNLNLEDFEKESFFELESLLLLKERINKEVSRRKYTNPINSFGADPYLFTPDEKINEHFLTEQINKVLRPMQAIHPLKLGYDDKYNINTNEYFSITDEDYILPLTDLINYLKQCETDSIQDYGKNHCMGKCTGLCSNTCKNTCDGCQGTCSGGCKGNCKGGESDTGGGGGGCSDVGGCTAACGNSCQGSGGGCSSGCLSTPCADGCGHGACNGLCGSGKSTNDCQAAACTSTCQKVAHGL